MQTNLTPTDIDRIIEMAWEDRTPFDAITAQFSLSEQQTIELMRHELKPSSFRMWRARVQGRATKHAAKAPTGQQGDAPRSDGPRFKSKQQRAITGNKLSKR